MKRISNNPVSRGYRRAQERRGSEVIVKAANQKDTRDNRQPGTADKPIANTLPGRNCF